MKNLSRKAGWKSGGLMRFQKTQSIERLGQIQEAHVRKNWHKIYGTASEVKGTDGWDIGWRGYSIRTHSPRIIRQQRLVKVSHNYKIHHHPSLNLSDWIHHPHDSTFLGKIFTKKDRYNKNVLGDIGKRESENDVAWITLQAHQFNWKKATITKAKGYGT